MAKKICFVLSSLYRDSLEKRALDRRTSIEIVAHSMLRDAIDRHESGKTDKVEELEKQLEESKHKISSIKQESVENMGEVTLEKAAETLIKVLDPTARNWIEEVSKHILYVPKWQLIMGHIRLTQDRGEMTSPAIDPAWESYQTRSELEKIAKNSKSVCSNCSKEFLPKQLGQQYCCNGCSASNDHSENCQFDNIEDKVIVRQNIENEKITEPEEMGILI